MLPVVVVITDHYTFTCIWSSVINYGVCIRQSCHDCFL